MPLSTYKGVTLHRNPLQRPERSHHRKKGLGAGRKIYSPHWSLRSQQAENSVSEHVREVAILLHGKPNPAPESSASEHVQSAYPFSGELNKAGESSASEDTQSTSPSSGECSKAEPLTTCKALLLQGNSTRQQRAVSLST